jgi:hypothetical protein
MFGRKRIQENKDSNLVGNVESNSLSEEELDNYFDANSDNCKHTWKIFNHKDEMLRCKSCGIPTYNLAFIAMKKSFTPMKSGIPQSVISTGGALAYAAVHFLDSMEPFIDALTEREMRDSNESYENAEVLVRNNLRSLTALTLINGMRSANGDNNWVDHRVIDNLVGAQLHDRVLQFGCSYSLPGHLGWPTLSGVAKPYISMDGETTLVGILVWLSNLSQYQHIPIRDALRKNWLELYEFACSQLDLGISGNRRIDYDSFIEFLSPEQSEMPLSKGTEPLVPKRDSIRKLRDLVQNFVPEPYQAPALLVAYRSLHESKCNQGRRMEDDEEIDLTELLLAPALRSQDGFQYINPEMDPFKTSGESVLKPRQDYEVVHRVMHRLPLAPIFFLDIWGEERMQFMYDWTRAVAEYQVADGYPSFAEQQVQMAIATSWEDSNWNLYLGAPDAEES